MLLPRISAFLLISAVFGLISSAQPGPPAKDRMVVVISLDGFPGFSFEDPKLPVPTLRRLIREGATASRMTVVNPSVTWPNHTAMVTGVLPGEHGLFFNGSLVKTGAQPPVKVDPWIEKETMVHAVTVYDQAFAAGLTTSQIDWVAIHKAKTITWAFPEVPSVDGPVEKEMIQKGIVTQAEVAEFRTTNILRRDEIWTDAAVHLIREHKPNLMLFHLLSLDSTHHNYGPKTTAGLAAMAFLDHCVARVVNAIDAAGMKDRATVIVVSDHGFKTYKKQIRPMAALTAAGIGGVYVVPEGGTAMVYIDKSKLAELTPKAHEVFAKIEGVVDVVEPSGFAALGFPDPAKEPQMADMVLVAKDGYSFSGSLGGPVSAEAPQPGGSHGYVASDPDMDAIFIASGYGIKPGVVLPRIKNLDVASTLANLLGVKLPGSKGRLLTEILR